MTPREEKSHLKIRKVAEVPLEKKYNVKSVTQKISDKE